METARNIVQDAFIALWEKRTNIDITKNVKSYLSTSIKNKCLNHLRDNNKFNYDLLDLEGLLIEKEPGPEAAFQAEELNTKIERLISELPVKCREIFILNRFEGYKYKKIATDKDISVKTVEAQISKALKYLRDNLRDYLLLLFLTTSITGSAYILEKEIDTIFTNKNSNECIRVIHQSGVLFMNKK